jgi:hypothetical protein
LLFCENNFLESLPELPNGLLMINCSNNKLKTIPALPRTRLTLNCAHNPLISLPNLQNVDSMTISVYQVPLLESTNLPEFTPLKNSNGTPFDSSTKLPVTTSNDAPVERPILNLRGYKFVEITVIDEKEEEYSKEFTKELENKYKAINMKFKELAHRLVLKCNKFLEKNKNIASVKITSQTYLPKLPEEVITRSVFRYFGGKKTKRKTHKKKRLTRKKSYKSKSKSGYK